MTGYTGSSDFPTTTGAYDKVLNGSTDIIISKMNATGTTLLYSTFLGGSGTDAGAGIRVDDKGYIFIGGPTTSSDFPTTPGVLSNTIGGILDSVFIKLVPNGSALAYSTYLGSYSGACSALTIDSLGNAYMVGSTGSKLPATTGAYQTTFGGTEDGFIAKLNSNATALLYCTYMGGDTRERLYDIDIDKNGSAYVAGWSGGNYPVTTGAFQTTLSGNGAAVLTKLAPNGSALIYSSYIGGSSGDNAYSLSVDDDGCAYVHGFTYSSDFPTSAWAYKRSITVSWGESFLFKMNATGTGPVFSTIIGDVNGGPTWAVEVDGNGVSYLAGVTKSSGYPVTSNAWDSTYSNWEGFFSIINHNGSSLVYSTYVGGSSDDELWEVALSRTGTVICVGYTSSSDFPATTGAYSTTYSGNGDAIVVAFPSDLHPPEFVIDRTPNSTTTGGHLTFNATIRDNSGISSASVEYWSQNDPAHRNISLNMTSGSVQNGTWSATIDISLHERGPLRYIMRASDDGGNTAVQPVKNVTVVDDRLPVILDDSDEGAYTGSIFSINVTVRDNIAIGDVLLGYGFEGGAWNNISLIGAAQIGKDLVMCLYDIDVPLNSISPMTYDILALDEAGNWNSTGNRTVRVIDNISPEFVADRSDASAYTGDPFTFRVEVTDNVEVDSVFVTYRIGQAAPINHSMYPQLGDNWSIVIDMPTNYAGKMTYRFSANDTSDNWNVGPEMTVNISDNDPPYLIEDLTPTNGTTGDHFEFSVSIGDNTLVLSCLLEYRYSDMEANNVNMVDKGGIWSYGITMISDRIGPILHYRYHFNDVYGNWNSTMERTVDVLDNDPPTFLNDLTDDIVVKGLELRFGVELFDNIGISSSFVSYRFGDGAWTNFTMEEYGTHYELMMSLPRWIEGDLSYYFSFSDTSGNWNVSDILTRTPINLIPDVPQPIIWNVTEEEDSSLDLGLFIKDGNDDPSMLSLTLINGTVSIDGLVLSVRYDAWIPDHVITLEVTDGEDTVRFDVNVHVINVNDPPVIVSTPPLTVTGGETYVYHILVEDEDEGDVYVYLIESGEEGMEIHQNGTVLWSTTLQDIGVHPVRITVVDGEYSVHQDWNITVIGPPGFNHPPYFTNTPPSTVNAGSEYSWHATAEDPDGDPLSFYLFDGPEGAAMDSVTGLLTWTPAVDRKDTNVTVTMTARVSDGEKEALFTFDVAVVYPPNMPPEIRDLNDPITISSRKVIDLTPHMFDPDDPIGSLTWSVIGGDPSLADVSIDGNKLVIDPVDGRTGEISITFVLEDPYGAQDRKEVTLEIVEDDSGGVRSWTDLCLSYWWLAIILIVIAIIAVAVWSKMRKGEGTSGSGEE